MWWPLAITPCDRAGCAKKPNEPGSRGNPGDSARPYDQTNPSAGRFNANWVSLSPKSVEARAGDRVIWGGRDSECLLCEAVKEQSPSA